MYLQSFGSPSAAAEDNRRRFPRVKPDEFGRISFEDLTPRRFTVKDLVAALNRPWLIALGGALAGALVSVFVAIALQGPSASPAAGIRTAERTGELADPVPAPPAGAAVRPRSAVGSRVESHRLETLLKLPPGGSLPPLQATPAPPGEISARPGKRDGLSDPSREGATMALMPAAASREGLVVMPGPDDNGALVLMPGPDSGGETSPLRVMQ